MKENDFFKPSPLYKEFMLLDLVSKSPIVTQREISEKLNISVSMVNFYLDKYESMGYVKRDYINPKSIHYHITRNGDERKKVLNMQYLEASLLIHFSAKENIVSFLNQIIAKGFRTIVLYGAGEVAEIMLQVINFDNHFPLKVVAVIDDNENKQGKAIVNTPVISKEELPLYLHDGILISSYIHNEQIFQKLVQMKYDEKKIIKFFE